jgi:hypothetical protein
MFFGKWTNWVSTTMAAKAVGWASVAGVLTASPACLAMDIETYDKQARLSPNSQAQVRLNTYLLGLGEGLRLANTALKARGLDELFCQPENLNLFAADYKRLIDGVLAGSRVAIVNAQVPIEQILLQALRESYPCPPR